MITIHEFSTGIIVGGTSNDDWFSNGFTGQVMNSTLSEVPQAIADEIANDLFNIKEGKSSKIPGMIGREVQKVTYQVDQNGQFIEDPQTGGYVELSREEWSVIAVVSSGDDEKGRSGSFYRYFLTQGLGKLEDILRWWHHSGKPQFAPFDIPNIGKPSIYNPSKSPHDHNILSQPKFRDLLNMTKEENTILIPHKILHQDIWIPGIKKYQEKIVKKKQEKDRYYFSLIDGIIGYNQNTYKVLKCEIASELEINLDINVPELQICKEILDDD